MITRIEIDGFKSFAGFRLDVPPVLVLLGPNGAGKSNLFDALRLVAAAVRGEADDAVRSDARLAPGSLFRRTGRDRASTSEGFTISVDAIVPASTGPLPVTIQLVMDRQEYRIERPGASLSYSAAVRVNESAQWSGDLPAAIGRDFLDTAEQSREEFLSGSDMKGLQLASVGRNPWSDHGSPSWDSFVPNALGDFNRQRNVQEELRHLVLQECADWQTLVLDPSVARRPAPALSGAPLGSNGANLAGVLERIANDAPATWSRLVADLAALVDGVKDVRTDYDDRRQELDFDVDFSHTGWCAPPMLSDGTLRMLGLLAAAADPARHGPLCVEEIENGMYAEKVADLLRRLGRRTGGRQEGPGAYRQLIATTHSPVLLAALREDLTGALVFLDQADQVDPDSRSISRTTVARPLRAFDPEAEPGETVTPEHVGRLLRRLGQGAA
ncbi:AAA family ATPase [Streptomyces sp. NPDC102384]|uniref:AAA family ATPase n=1 Tax=Streptomyces sp. NPDC102384 TaxID=3366166 RepID=UPI003803D932